MALEIPRAIVDALARYNSTFRHPTLRPLEPSPLYALFPLELGAVTAPVGWPSEWPRGDGPGVYLIFGGEMQLIYVGKARRLGDRLGTYFKPSSSNRELCEIFRREEWWRTRPAFVATIACDADKAFEASAVEEYLIEVLQPAENKRWGARG